MGGLVELLGIEREAEAQSDAWAEEDVVGEGSNTAVVDLGLFTTTRSVTMRISLALC